MKKNRTFFVFLIIDIVIALLSVAGLIMAVVMEKGLKTFGAMALSILIVSVLVGLMMIAVKTVIKPVETEGEVKEGATAICPTCGNENPGDAPYCLHCGSPLK